MADLSDVMDALVTHLQADTVLTGMVDSITTDAGYDKIPRGMRLHVRPISNNANEEHHLGARSRDVIIGLVMVGRHIRQRDSDVDFMNLVERLDKTTLSFLAQSDLTNRRSGFVYETELADDYPETRIEYASVSYRVVEV